MVKKNKIPEPPSNVADYGNIFGDGTIYNFSMVPSDILHHRIYINFILILNLMFLVKY
jgi:hypothetical protein